MKIDKKTAKKYLVSSLITFFTGFALVLVAQVDSLTLSSLGSGALAGLIFAGTRAGVKAVAEYFLVVTK